MTVILLGTQNLRSVSLFPVLDLIGIVSSSSFARFIGRSLSTISQGKLEVVSNEREIQRSLSLGVRFNGRLNFLETNYLGFPVSGILKRYQAQYFGSERECSATLQNGMRVT